MHTEIIDYIRRNRVSTTEVADCLGKSGALTGVSALNRGHFCVGTVHWAYGWAESNWYVHERIQDAPESSVVVVTPIECGNRALIGDLVAKYLLLYRQVGAIVVEGNVRDAPRLYKENWPVWCSGTNPVGCYKSMADRSPTAENLAVGERYDGAIAVCDDCGVVIIEKQHQNAEFLEKLAWIEKQEDIWYECIDRRKWSTFDTVCLEKYKTDTDLT